MKSWHRLIFGDAESMEELDDNTVHLVVTSPPYFNAPFDYLDLFESYEAYLAKMRAVAKEVYRVVDTGGCVSSVMIRLSKGRSIQSPLI